MGMAASQARFLGLTARKTNVEYEGQQVNQERTALATQSAGLFNNMLELKVPVPPSATDFYSMRYTFESGNQKCQILDYRAGQNGKYDITIRKTEQRQKSYVSSFNVTPTFVGAEPAIKYAGKDYALKLVSDEALAKEQGLSESQFYQFVVENADKTTTTYNLLKSEYDAAQKDVSKVMKNYYWKETPIAVTEQLKNVEFEKDAQGRFTAIKLLDGTQIPLNIEQVQDDVGYATAMNNYNYQKMLYERTVEDINKQTEIIQQQDRTLELKLRQLDTEQEALQQEMEAVKKVIDKNVESTFKTFA